MLPYLFRHYDTLVSRYFVFDDGSTDHSVDLLSAHPKVTLSYLPVAGDSVVLEGLKFYNNAWKQSRDQADCVIVCVPLECEQSYHMFYSIMPSFESRQALISHLAGLGILAVFHYLPLHLSPMGLRFGGRLGDCPVTEKIADRLLRLPFYAGMTDSEQTQLIGAVRAFSLPISVTVNAIAAYTLSPSHILVLAVVLAGSCCKSTRLPEVLSSD
jgi:dTDP-4-amino-4,6-dideoxygalactose transaminase